MNNQGFTSERTLEQMQKLIDDCFEGNAILDNVVYAMNILPINASKLYEFVHYTLSHALPTKFADTISDLLLLRGSHVYRGAIPIHNKVYNNVIECLEDVLEVFLNVQKQVEVCIDTAVENKDKVEEDFLRSFNVDVAALYVKQAITLLEGAKQFENVGMLPMFNKDFESYVIIK